jgi:hypothetical protein
MPTTEEQRGYARGYAAGRKRVQRDRQTERYQAERQAFLDRAFMAALSACIDAKGWTRGEKPITTLDERVRLAWDAAESALKQRRIAK